MKAVPPALSNQAFKDSSCIWVKQSLSHEAHINGFVAGLGHRWGTSPVWKPTRCICRNLWAKRAAVISLLSPTGPWCFMLQREAVQSQNLLISSVKEYVWLTACLLFRNDFKGHRKLLTVEEAVIFYSQWIIWFSFPQLAMLAGVLSSNSFPLRVVLFSCDCPCSATASPEHWAFSVPIPGWWERCWIHSGLCVHDWNW